MGGNYARSNTPNQNPNPKLNTNLGRGGPRPETPGKLVILRMSESPTLKMQYNITLSMLSLEMILLLQTFAYSYLWNLES